MSIRETGGRVVAMPSRRLALERAPDEVLCRVFLDGEEAAFEVLVTRHRALVFSLVRRYTTRPEDAADLTQAAFLRALEASRRVFARFTPVGPAPFRAWLVRIALNLAKNHARHGQRWRPVLVEAANDEVAEAPGESAQDGLERAERAREVREAVLTLPRRQREVLTLRVDAGLAFKDIAETLGITENNAKVQFHHAVKRLKARVGEPEEMR
ncbi:sigma-70 family RNA polymerase sigma factor [Myxococcus llanfairpwllgwyngyllgogerychwyrndrobwllllantysiliogogogochensis]|uniref:Sigma-70 family RNA polymerase sigma factor n=1 Tax=Myxococcus llanfairpwllgwyngyllgogerychwyrndrobwllllantysiliogogogochensis TaxID=2590453 RepID=A0A540X3F2_9BACT|nr:sigma-70 family RNA polymerase sigma factor [Myxococcus llanfairpwllgwyngyllgogerychwyrndrobwllllantysiliogogogochensis]TQF15776.1 sigma-70 family RNA polymerase sigma factor [Myxococcus llanfairpwllgwyngyllgogerychwyrndrobwllllantysiliogogogochensis]